MKINKYSLLQILQDSVDSIELNSEKAQISSENCATSDILLLSTQNIVNEWHLQYY